MNKDLAEQLTEVAEIVEQAQEHAKYGTDRFTYNLVDVALIKLNLIKKKRLEIKY